MYVQLQTRKLIIFEDVKIKIFLTYNIHTKTRQCHLCLRPLHKLYNSNIVNCVIFKIMKTMYTMLSYLMLSDFM